MLKSELRQQFLARRKALSADEVEQPSRAIGEQVFSRDVISFGEMTSLRVIHTFLPILRQNEVNTWPLIHRIWQEQPGLAIVVSRTDPASKILTHYDLTPETNLTPNRWGIPEPDPVSSVQRPTSQIDLVLVPLLAFDRQGHRVGYGGGYYDRFLADCRPDCLKIGLSLFDPVNTITDVEPTDIRLDACATPNEIIWFSTSPS